MTDYLLATIAIILFLHWYEHSAAITHIKRKTARWLAEPKRSVERVKSVIYKAKERRKAKLYKKNESEDNE